MVVRTNLKTMEKKKYEIITKSEHHDFFVYSNHNWVEVNTNVKNKKAKCLDPAEKIASALNFHYVIFRLNPDIFYVLRILNQPRTDK